MKDFLLIFLFFFSITYTPAQAESIVLQGVYQEKNLYIQNPESDDGFGFSAREVRINGDLYSGNINSSAFEIDFSNVGIDKGTPVEVLIEYEGDVAPKPLNPFCIQPESTYQLEEIKLNQEGLLTFKTKNEKGSLPYIIQQYRWNKWMYVGELEGDGKPDLTEHQFKTILHSGENIVRVVQRKQDGSFNISQSVSVDNPEEKVEMSYKEKQNKIVFSRSTFYEIHNAYGILLKKGYGKELDIKNFKSINFLYLSFDNTTKSFKP